jgi:hypothetical protein
MNTDTAAAPTDPPQDPTQEESASPFANNIAYILHATRLLVEYGRHLLGTIRQRSTAPNFSAIAVGFGTANLSTILAHLNRGLLRAAALEKFLLARDAADRDIPFAPDRSFTLEPGPMPEEGAAPDQPVAPEPEPRAIRKRALGASRPTGWNDPELFMPTMEDLEREVRRQPIGRTILKICLDLAVVPGLCHRDFWNEIFHVMTWFGSLNTTARLVTERNRRREAFSKEQDRNPKATWDWVNLSTEKLHQILGFAIGELPVNPLEPAVAIATEPP